MQFFIDVVLLLIYLWVFLILIAYIWKFWMMYVNEQHLHSLKYVMLEIKLPREINKSPVAFEYVANALIQSGGVSTAFDRQWKGALPAVSSLEIASLEGVIHFYIRTLPKFRSIVESNLYAQYPNIEVVEVEDYTKLIRYEHNKKDVSMWGISSVLNKTWAPIDEKGKTFKKDDEDYKMPADFLPIKTYVDYGLDKDPKEEFKNDPLIPMLEFFGSLGEGQYAWYQLLIQDESCFDKKFPKTYVNEQTHDHVSIKDMAKDRKKQIRSTSLKKKGDKVFDDYGYPVNMKGKEGEEGEQKEYQEDTIGSKKEMELTPEEKDEIEAINKKMSKSLARCIMRVLYVSKKDKFNPGYISTITSLMKPFAGFNGFRPKTFSSGGYDYPWQNTFKKREPWRSEEFFNDYVERAGFHPHTGLIDTKNKNVWEDVFFWNFKASTRNLFHTVYETILHPFGHPETSDVFTLNTEEIATLYHFPGETATVPTLPRIDSIKGKAPTNLPI